MLQCCVHSTHSSFLSFVNECGLIIGDSFNFCFLGMEIDASSQFKLLSFGLSCAIMAIIIVTIDLVQSRGQREASVFKIGLLEDNTATQKIIEALIIIMKWAFCAGIVGFLGVSLNVLQFSIHACFIVAVSWIYILSLLLHTRVYHAVVNQNPNAANGEV